MNAFVPFFLRAGNRGFLALVLSLLPAFAFAWQSEQKIDVKLEKSTLKDLFNYLESKTGYTFNYFQDEVDLRAPVTVNLRQATLQQTLREALAPTLYGFKIDGRSVIIARKAVPAKQATGRLSGVLVDAGSGDPLAGATIMAGSTGQVTDIAGKFLFELPEGSYALQVRYIGYQPKKINDVNVAAGQTRTLNLTLQPAKGTLRGVEVVSSANKESISSLYARQKNNAAVSDGISAEQIRRTPDNNVGQVLKRISGLTVQDNKFVIVRGMSERYNNMLLNGSSLPSTEPNRRNFSFDIIPSNLIDNVVVNKTATPDLPGEFTGGLVQVNTLDIPASPFLQVLAGTGFNSQSTGKEFLSTRRLQSDYWGAPGKERLWFDRQWSSTEFAKLSEKGDQAGLNAMNGKIPNFYGLRSFTAKPMQQYQLSMGGSKRFSGNRTLGLVLAGTYRHEENIETFDAWFRQSPTIVDNGRQFNFISAVGALGNLAFQTPKHKLVWRNVYNNRFTHENIVQVAEDKSRAGRSHEYISIVEAGRLFQTRLEGEHKLGQHLKLNWFADHATVNKEQPDTRYSVGDSLGIDPKTGLPLLMYQYSRLQTSTIKEGGLYANRLQEKKRNIGGDLTFPFQFAGRAQKIKTGYWGTFRKAEYAQVMLAPTSVGMNNPDRIRIADSLGYGKPDYEVFKPENFRAGYFTYFPTTTSGLDAADHYDGKQALHAGYLMADVTPLPKLRVIAGVRLESSKMDVHTYTRIVQGSTVRAKDTTISYRETDWLPSVNIVYQLTPQLNIRGAYSKTLARPDFRERASFMYYDLKLRQDVKGIQGLEYSRAHNADLRFEWYPSPVEVLALTVFYKKYDKPVETVSYVSADNRYGVFYFNLESAVNKGLELDYRHSFSFISKTSAFWKNLFLTANLTVMDSKVTYDNENIQLVAAGHPPKPSTDSTKNERKRPLQGLSPYIINTGLSWQGTYFGANVTFNRFGRRVIFAGLDDYDDTYENPRNQLDLQLNARLLKQRMEIRLNVADVLNQYYIDYFNKYPDARPPQSPPNIEYSNTDDPKGMGYNPDSDWKLKRTRKGTNWSMTVSYRL